MKITLPQVLRAMPLLAANLVPLAGVTFELRVLDRRTVV